ncbi:MAG: hypothetical protein H7832_13310 [Magnetococcus sp. DMHC-6]
MLKNYFPSTNYDFFKYLTPGFTLLFGLDIVLNGGTILKTPLTLQAWIMAFALAYLSGHLIAEFSQRILEHFLSNILNLNPISLLIEHTSSQNFFNWLLTGYYKILSPEKRQQILNNFPNQKATQFFRDVYLESKKIPGPQKRLKKLKNQYELARNLTLAVLIIGMAGFGTHVRSLWHGFGGYPATHWLYIDFAFFLGGVLYLRYLKFFAKFTLEAYINFPTENPQ